MSDAVLDDYKPGLEGVVSNETAISNIEGKEGAGGLEYRGYAIEDLSGKVSYEETAFLLLHGDLPTNSQLSDFNARLRASLKPFITCMLIIRFKRRWQDK